MKKQFVTTEQLLYRVNAKDGTNRQAWYYVLVNPTMLIEFKKKLMIGTLKLSQYGEIVASGYGDTVPDHVKTKLELRFGKQLQS